MGSSSSSHDSDNSCSVGDIFSAAPETGKQCYAFGSKVGEFGGTVLGGAVAIAFGPETAGLSVAGTLGAAAVGGYVASVIKGSAAYLSAGAENLAYNTYQFIK
ncbi:hypothetical protein [Bartonella senegalensis]|uniref:hypothetical protein n=1 Tax=Bartonella senegalensis TaxID=1468418 RepID=UPI0002F00986|nr:hypothetical protein [Bartonella senegalensis]